MWRRANNILSSLYLVVHETPVDSKKDDYDDKSTSVEEEKNMSEEEEITSVKKNKSTKIVNIDDLDSDDEPIGKRLAPSIAKRLRNITGKDAALQASHLRLPRKVLLLDMIKIFGKKVPTNVPEVSINNISFHSVENVEKWKFVYQKRLALERELGKDSLECKAVVGLIKNAGLMKSVSGFGKCYEMKVKDFIMNIPTNCDNKKSKEYIKVYMRGRCMEFSPEVINRFIGRCKDEQAEVEVIDNTVCKEITTKQVSQWLRKGKLSASKLSVKYVVLHRTGTTNWVPTNHTSTIATGLGKFIYIVGTKTKFDFGSYVFEKTLKHHPGILINSDVTSKRESPISLRYRLFAGIHVPKIVMTSGKETVSSTSKDENIDVYATIDEETYASSDI
ncbi:uncharacterized protein LOC127104835 [Lathyrus oleraceus]|uniref:uncharacterized protein LOC127104835 n=1 Tax=Pisum sativum TaxID=3888 RepID=UPI0021D3AD5B|nr:uncharacterized protein LOC127104835 [Pisum sativum]